MIPIFSLVDPGGNCGEEFEFFNSGLDFTMIGNGEDGETQKRNFHFCCELALTLGLPVTIHGQDNLSKPGIVHPTTSVKVYKDTCTVGVLGPLKVISFSSDKSFR